MNFFQKSNNASNNKGWFVETIKSTSFQATLALLKEDDTIAKAKRCLLRFDKLAGYLHGTGHVPNMRPRVNMSVFLSSLMIIAWPSDVFKLMVFL